tara:strand:+ start:18859 stop:19959 length:1101 start_codon:yes stop_codon:yes gene_type:complete
MKIPQFMPLVGKDEYTAIKKCFEDNWITEGPQAKIFKEKLLKLIGSKHGEFAPNGTLAIYLALKAAGVQPGDEVLVPNFTFIASATSVVMVGATPIFVDVDENLQIDLSKCGARLSDKTTAIMTAHMYGTCGDMPSVMQFARKHGLVVVEDAAQALGVTWDGQHAGTFGDVATFSFFADKTITCGEGGFVITNDDNVAEELVYLRNQGRINRGTFVHPEIGYNFRITDMHAAMGNVQIGKLDWIVGRKLEIYQAYKKRLQSNSRFSFFGPMKKSGFIPFRVCIIDKLGQASNVMDKLQEHGVEPRTFFYPMHKQPCFSDIVKKANYSEDEFSVSNKMYESGVCLPTFLQITDEEIDYICDIINSNF